jgi:hypothetical protein
MLSEILETWYLIIIFSDMMCFQAGVRTAAIVRYLSEQYNYIVCGQGLSNLTGVSNYELKIISV